MNRNAPPSVAGADARQNSPRRQGPGRPNYMLLVFSVAIAMASILGVITIMGERGGALAAAARIWSGLPQSPSGIAASDALEEDTEDDLIEDVRLREAKLGGKRPLRSSRLPRGSGGDGESDAVRRAMALVSEIDEDPALPDDGGETPEDGGEFGVRKRPGQQLLVDRDAPSSSLREGRQGIRTQRAGGGGSGGDDPTGRTGGGGSKHEKLRIPVVMSPTHGQIVADLAPWQQRGILLEDMHAALARDMEKPTSQRRLVLCAIIDGRLVMDYDSWGSNRRWGAKLSDFLAQLRSVLQAEGVSVPDVVFLVQVASLPFLRRDASGGIGRRAPPVLSMAKSDNYADVLYPNPYFGRWDKWERSANGLLALADALRWEEKRSVAFWRGSCVNWPGSMSRVDLVMKHEQPRMDVAFTRSCPTERWPPIFPDRESDRMLKRQVRRLPTSRIVSRADFAKYKFLFHMPGSTHGSYSRNFQIVLGTGSVVLKWDNPFYEFFYSTLVEGEHFVAVNASNVGAVVERLASHDAASRRIAESTVSWFRTHLRGRHIRDYWVQLLHEYAKLQRFKPAPPEDPCSCDKDRQGLRKCKLC